ncbi:MAG: TPM domain-containing protein [Burkholderiales bacterium]|nr:TPM domain-containing protein [Burkholderiales bacterium]
MELARFWRHVAMSPLKARRCFTPATLDRLQARIAEAEKRHRGEIRFVVEAELTTEQLWRGITSRERSREVFASQGVWNTAENNGVLIYLLLADRRVEIVADRGIDARVDPSEWQAICRMMEAHFREGGFEEGALAGVDAVSELLARHFPGGGERPNELEDRPTVM